MNVNGFSLFETTLLGLAWKGAGVLLIAVVASMLLSRRSAGVRHLVWCSAMIALLAIPILGAVVPTWEADIPLVPRLERIAFTQTGASVPVLDAAGAADATVDPIEAGSVVIDRRAQGVTPHGSSVTAPVADDASRINPTRAGGAASATSPEISTQLFAPAASTSADSDAAGATPTAFAWPDARTIIWFVWVFGFVVVMFDIIIGHALALQATRKARELNNPRLLGILADASARLGLMAKVELRASDNISVPCTWGMRRPTILLPAAATRWSDARLRMVLTHELGHITRFDWLTQLLSHVACAIHWFNPLAWMARSKAMMEQEAATDDLVLGCGDAAQAYATNLLDIARSSLQTRAHFRSLSSATIAMSRPSSLEGRLLAILDSGRDRSRFNGRRMVGTVALVVLMLVPLAAVQPRPVEAGLPSLAEPAVPSQALVDMPRQSGAQTAPVPADDAVARTASVDGVSTAGLSDATKSDEISGSELPDAEARDIAPGSAIDERTVPFGDAPEARSPEAHSPEIQSKDSEKPRRDSTKVKVLLDALANESEAEVRVYLVRILGDMEDPLAIAGLSRVLLNDESDEVRAVAAWSLGSIEDPAAAPALGTALERDASVEVRRQVIWALGELGAREAAPAIERALVSDASAEVREYAAWALGEMELDSSVEPLEKALNDESDGVRLKAAWALGEIESERSVSLLERLLSDRSAEVRQYAAHALGNIARESSVEPLARALSDSDRDVRVAAIHALGEIGSAASVAPLSNALSDEDDEVRARAAWSLAEIGSSNAVNALMSALKDPSAEVRRHVVRALGEIKANVAADALLDLLRNDPDPEVRKMAAMSLSELDF